MKKILHVVNNISKTSIPHLWVTKHEQNVVQMDITPLSKISIKMFKEFDIIHLHHLKSAFLISFINLLFCVPTLFTVHGSYRQLSRINKLLFYIVIFSCKRIVFVNSTLFIELPTFAKSIIKNKYLFINNAVDLSDCSKYKTVDVKRKYNFTLADKMIFHPARFVKEKNHTLILYSFKKLLIKNPNVKLILAGDGELKAEIIKLINALSLTDKVLLTGTISKDEVFSFLKESDLFIMPSISEGLNVAFLEALSFNQKILVSEIPSFSSFAEENMSNISNFNIVFSNPYSIESMTKGMDVALSQIKNMDLNLDFMSITKMFKQYEIIYSGI